MRYKTPIMAAIDQLKLTYNGWKSAHVNKSKKFSDFVNELQGWTALAQQCGFQTNAECRRAVMQLEKTKQTP